MKKKKPKIKPPRITWERKPMVQVQDNGKGYNRNREKQKLFKGEI